MTPPSGMSTISTNRRCTTCRPNSTTSRGQSSTEATLRRALKGEICLLLPCSHQLPNNKAPFHHHHQSPLLPHRRGRSPPSLERRNSQSLCLQFLQSKRGCLPLHPRNAPHINSPQPQSTLSPTTNKTFLISPETNVWHTRPWGHLHTMIACRQKLETLLLESHSMIRCRGKLQMESGIWPSTKSINKVSETQLHKTPIIDSSSLLHQTRMFRKPSACRSLRPWATRKCKRRLEWPWRRLPQTSRCSKLLQRVSWELSRWASRVRSCREKVH
mmetsp:Transcript_4973/g.18701  ORF Transcript_4973/g.18701 Transcript_4973/m.18701 type:complete len:272 (+) Transcript_4973:2569-3384(+)